MNWGQPLWLFALAVPFLLALGAALAPERGENGSEANAGRLRARIGPGGPRLSPGRRARPRPWLLCLSLTSLCLALARPQWGTIERETFERSREVVIAVDVSKSMLAEDLRPSRLGRAKLLVHSLLDALQGESVGLALFAGTAFLQSPMSPDYQVLRKFVEELNPGFIPQGGTSYRAMLRTALDAFGESPAGQADRFLIVVSDGESEGEDWEPLAKQLAERGVKALCLGMGTTEGALIPDGTGGFHKNPQGAAVLTRLEPRALQTLAAATGGVYRHAKVWIDLEQLIEETVKQGKAAQRAAQVSVARVERFQHFLAAGLALALLALYRECPAHPKPRIVKPPEPPAQ